jgi:hypothetical protein
VSVTLSMRASGCSRASGSAWNTSSPASPIWPLCSAGGLSIRAIGIHAATTGRTYEKRIAPLA